MNLLNYIHWNIDPVIFSAGSFEFRYYGILFASGFIIGYYIMQYFFKREKVPLKELDAITTYSIIGTIIGARLGHVIFYQPQYYLDNPSEILMIWHGGLASHGGAIGILIALYFFSRKSTKKSYLWTLDRFVIPTALAGFFIRMGNLMNSEIYGYETSVPWGFIFVRNNEVVPKHPTQIYEALAYLFIFIFLFFIYKKYKGKIPKGLLFGIFLVGVFGFRFFIEFLKQNQANFEQNIFLNMGQILSIPFIVVGIFFIYKALKKKTEKIVEGIEMPENSD